MCYDGRGKKLIIVFSSSCDYVIKTWLGCSSLTAFPLLDTKDITSLESTWEDCSLLKSFPLLNTGKVSDFRYAWKNCSTLKVFPSLDMSSCASLEEAWGDCSSLKQIGSIAQNIDIGSVINFDGLKDAFLRCTSLSALYFSNISTNLNLSGTALKCAELEVVFNNLITTGSSLSVNVKGTPASTTELNTNFPSITSIAANKGWVVIW